MRPSAPSPVESVGARLRETQAAFDSVAADYDGPRGNNELIQEMRREMWRNLDAAFCPGSDVLDLGCGTGLDAVHLASRGVRVTATDWSGAMTARTAERARSQAVENRVQALQIGAHELHRLDGERRFDGVYSNLGPLNCVPDLTSVAAECARLTKPGARAIFTVIGRICPWEMLWYALRGDWPRIRVRYARGLTPVGMNRQRVWTRYFTPHEFRRAFAPGFEIEEIRALCLFAPPPYLIWVRERHPRWHRLLWSMDRTLGGWPLLNRLGDHFLIRMRRSAADTSVHGQPSDPAA